LESNQMNEAAPDSSLTVSRPAGCPFTIEYSPRVLDDIRLAIVDAFCSLPRGGAEIGGVLMGRWEPGLLRILGYAPLDCEHAYGPSFSLSPNDEARMRELLAHAPARFPGLAPAGWYHSHTRSEIFLSDDDLLIHDRFFPEPWQVALVLRPHMMQPTRAGFFFREAGGAIHASAAREEFSIDAQPMRPVPAGPVEMPPAEGRPRTLRMERNPEIGVPAQPVLVKPPVAAPADVPEQPHLFSLTLDEEVEAAAEQPDLQQFLEQHAPEQPTQGPPPASEPLPVAPPAFLSAQDPAPRRWLAPLLVVCGLAAGAAGYFTHPSWLPSVLAVVRPAAAAPAPATLRLNAIEHEGQIQINWDSQAAPVRSAVDATLEIADGSQLPQAIGLDQAHLQSGMFTYVRQNERVDLKLTLQQPDGTKVNGVTTFLGKVPERSAVVKDPEVRKERDELARQAAKLKDDLEKQAARTRKLEKDLKGMQDEKRQQQQRRMTNMIPAK
jgi:proteasome lid subunit RPN8/RPN11